jgi:hypothetical protein
MASAAKREERIRTLTPGSKAYIRCEAGLAEDYSIIEVCRAKMAARLEREAAGGKQLSRPRKGEQFEIECVADGSEHDFSAAEPSNDVSVDALAAG